MANTQTIEGKIEAANDRGLKVGGQWFNYSAYPNMAEPDPFLEVGQGIQLTATQAGWIKSILTAEQLEAAQARTTQVVVTRPAPAAQPVLMPAPTAPITKDEMIARQSMMKAACAFYAGNPHADLKAITDLADALVAHVLRGLL